MAAPSLIDTPAASTTDLVPRMLSQDAARLLRLLRSGWLLVDRSDRVIA
ncbi:MAG: two-component sensor histidine kinase, partial [Dermacoccus nishinomiyaensis]